MQNGSLIQTMRRSGQSVWEFRWRDRTTGRAVYRRIVVGTTQQFATEVEAREIVKGIVLRSILVIRVCRQVCSPSLS